MGDVLCGELDGAAEIGMRVGIAGGQLLIRQELVLPVSQQEPGPVVPAPTLTAAE